MSAVGVAQTPTPQCSGDLKDSTAMVTASPCPTLISQGEQGQDGPVGKEVQARALWDLGLDHGIIWPDHCVPRVPVRGHPCHPAPLCLHRVPQENQVPQDPLARR